MADTTPFITQTKLNMLFERVCRPIDYLGKPITTTTPLWEEPISICQRIEKELLTVYNVVIEARKREGHFSNTNTPLLYQAVLCRVFILLYYRHGDDEYYQKIVYPMLKENMGGYGSKYLNTIKENINKIIELEKLCEKAEAEKKREASTPKFSLPELSRGELDHLFDEYNEEKLFRNFTLLYDTHISPDDEILDQAELWYAAKDIVRKLWLAKYPETYIERILQQFDTDLGYIGASEPQYVMMCVYAMMRSVAGSHFEKAIRRIESYSQNTNTDFHYLRKHISIVKQWINETSPFDDYDYVGERPEQEQATVALDDIERIKQQVIEQEKADSEKLQKKVEALETSLSEKENLCEAKDNRIKELEAQIHDQPSSKADHAKYDMTVELLTHLFYENEADVKEFLKKIENMEDAEITDLVRNWVEEKRISSKSHRRDLWRILHAAKLYNATESNYNTALKKNL